MNHFWGIMPGVLPYCKETKRFLINYRSMYVNEFTPKLDWESEDYKWLNIKELYEQDNLHFGLSQLLIESKNIIQKL